MNRTDSRLEAVLDPIKSEGVESEDERLLLWLIRTLYDVSPADSYASILRADEDMPEALRDVDAAVVSTSRELLTPVYVLLADDPKTLINRAKRVVAALIEEPDAERKLSRRSAQLRSVFEDALSSRLEVSRVLNCICRAPLTTVQAGQLRRLVKDTSIEIEVHDIGYLNSLAAAELQGAAWVPEVQIDVPPEGVLNLTLKSGRGLMVPVSATAVARWPGVEDRTLFDLNVRHALGKNRVRRSLDEALSDAEAAADFIAYHNGITAVCRSYEVGKDHVRVEGLSVVNGAQSVVAVHANAERLDPEIKILLKLVEAPYDSELSRNIAIRSNTQNPVTSRNLRALDPVQLRLEREVAEFGYVYVVRPDSQTSSTDRLIQNDDAAQLLCSTYVRKPALAVKRQVLFELPQYSEIFSPATTGARVVFVYLLRKAVEEVKETVPADYRRAWALTSLTLVWMTSEAMRSDPHASTILLEPDAHVRNPRELEAILGRFAGAARAVLVERHQRFEETGDDDDFKVEFKQTRTLTDLGARAVRSWRTLRKGLPNE